MGYKKGELIRLGFSADGGIAYCDIDFDIDGSAEPDDGRITVKVHVPIDARDTIQKLRELAIDAARQRLKAASK